MNDEKLNRRALMRLAGGALVAGSAAGATSAYGSGGPASAPGEGRIATVTDVEGSTAGALSADGRRHRGTVQSNRPLRPGDRVVITSEPDGSPVVSPLYVPVEGVVESVDRESIVIDRARYSIDGASAAKTLQQGRWVEAGALADAARTGAFVGALCITNDETGAATVAMAWV